MQLHQEPMKSAQGKFSYEQIIAAAVTGAGSSMPELPKQTVTILVREMFGYCSSHPDGDGVGLVTHIVAKIGVASPPSAPQPPVSTSSCAVAAAGYARLATGDSYAETVEKLGCEGSEVSRSEIAGYTTVMYQWLGRGFGANMNAMFQNDRLVSKAEFGL
jgi:hypothetical protein